MLEELWDENIPGTIEDYATLYEFILRMGIDIEGDKKEEEKYKFILCMEGPFNEALSRAKYWLGPCGTPEFQSLIKATADTNDEAELAKITARMKEIKDSPMSAFDEEEFLISQGY